MKTEVTKIFVLILGLILGLTGCTYETVREEDTMPEDDIIKGWAQGGLITPGVPSVGVSCQASFKEAGNYTAQFFIGDDNNDPAGNWIFRARAELAWTVNGNDARRIIDCVNGMSIQGVGQSVKIRIYDDSVNGGPGYTPKQYYASVQVSKGSRASVNQPPYYSTDIFSLNGGGNQSLIIPVNAGAISVNIVAAPSVIGGGPITPNQIKVSQYANTSIASGLLKEYDPLNKSFEPLAAGAKMIYIETDPAADPITFQVTYGIDG